MAPDPVLVLRVILKEYEKKGSEEGREGRNEREEKETEGGKGKEGRRKV